MPARVRTVPVWVAEKVPDTERLPVAEGKVKQLVLAAEFVQDLREVRCLSTDDFQRWDLPRVSQLVVTTSTTLCGCQLFNGSITAQLLILL
jgi:hypothetical protein